MPKLTLQKTNTHYNFRMHVRKRNIHESEMLKVQSLTVAELNFMGL